MYQTQAPAEAHVEGVHHDRRAGCSNPRPEMESMHRQELPGCSDQQDVAEAPILAGIAALVFSPQLCLCNLQPQR